ncbi:hypothetical protein CFT13S00388_02510 [Campylobacter fetus subsp. testudinum]|uniref:portal protein n=1 Tax=Campylobacter fetus TaxID=196 RepID=UPI000818B5A9|nr:hypothetical protein [Campylobacter fetus]OCR88058.1 hypothetical protein CFT13S00388_02510 [Campylobacter fetus subsp. testudinum]
MKLNKKEILSALKRDFEAAKKVRSSLDSKISTWKSGYNGEPYGNESKNRSKIVSRDIKKQSEWQHPSLVEPFISTPDIIKANPVTFEDAAIAPSIEILLNTQFCRQFNRYNFINKAIKVLDQEGTVVVRTGWEYEEKVVEDRVEVQIPNPELEQLSAIIAQFEQAGRIEEASQLKEQAASLPKSISQYNVVKKNVPIKNHPTAMVCRNEDIFIDPTCQDDLSKAQFIIYRYETDMTTLKSSGIYTNLDKISYDEEDSDYNNPDKTEFKFKDNPRKKLLVYEYWGNYDVNSDDEAEPIICTWVGDTIIRLEDNPFPDKKPPFILVPFNAIPFSLYGESNAELLEDVQKIKTAIYRGFLDNMSLSNNGQKGIKKGALDLINKKRFMNGDNFEFNGTPNDFFDGHFNELPSSAFNLLQLMNNEAESITGVKSFSQGMNSNALGGTSTGIQGVLDSASSRRLNIVRNISENLIKPLLRKWLAYDAEFLDEESQFRITNNEFVYLKRDDLGANIDIELTISTSDDNKATANELAFLLQTLGPSENPELRKMLMADICDLYRRPELANKIRTFQPEPDPMQQQLAALQLQLLEAQVMNERSKAGKNEVDSGLKEAKTQTELAKAENISSKTDSSDLDYLHKYYGVKTEQDKQQANLSHQYDMDKESLKLIANASKQNL